MSGLSYLGQPAADLNPYLNMPTINVPLPDSPLPSHAASPDPMAYIDLLAQPAYVHDLTRMLGFMNESQVHFQEQIARAITALTSSQAALASSQGAVSDSQATHGSSTVKLRNPCTFNGRHEEVFLFCPRSNTSSNSIRQVFLTTIEKFFSLLYT